MNCVEYKDNPDGSATIILETSEKERQYLLEYAVNNILREYIEKELDKPKQTKKVAKKKKEK